MKQRVRKTTSSPKHKKAQIFSPEEYSSLRNETVERISIMNNQASSAFGILLTTWGGWFYAAWHTCFMSGIRQI